MSGLGARLLALRRSLGPRGTAALTAALLAVVTVAAVAVAGGHSDSSHTPLAVQAARPSGATATSAAAGRSPRQRAAAKHRQKRETNRAKPASHANARVRHGSARPANHPAAARPPRHASRPRRSTTTTPRPPAGAVSVTFIVHGGGNASLVACGDTHHFRTYAPGAGLSFSGAVRPVPSGQWKIKLHIKVCQGGAYHDFAKIDAHEHQGTGTFHGTFRAPRPGLYEVRAVLYLGDSESTESDKLHLETR